jgi:hypothetical protein
MRFNRTIWRGTLEALRAVIDQALAEGGQADVG